MSGAKHEVREVDAALITESVRKLCIDANLHLPCAVERALRDAADSEPWPSARATLEDLARNLDIAAQEQVAICQDTGIVTVFVDLGQDVHVVGGDLNEAIQEGVRRGYEDGYLRKSVVADPLRRVNTRDNTPAVVVVRIVAGNRIALHVAPKGAGSENMCCIKMLKPADGIDGVRQTVLDAVIGAGGKPCPPTVVGVGIGGTFDSVGRLAKEALLRPIDEPNADPFYAQLERELLGEINASGIGPGGLGGATTALAVLINAAPTHIAMLPVAVCISCHVTRHASEVL
jgi:fumarate hydratase subunit alpha